MATSKKSLGTLAAVASLSAAPCTNAAVEISPFSNVALTANVERTFDVDGDGTDDIGISVRYNNGSPSQIIFPSGGGLSKDEYFLTTGPATYLADALGAGASVGLASDYQSSNIDLDNFSEGTFYAGFYFYPDDGADLHFGYLEIEAPDEFLADGNGVVIGGAWESVKETPITTAPVPEPSTYAATGGLLAVGLAFIRRLLRRRSQ